MDINKRLELIKQVGEEIITEDDLKDLLQKKKSPIAYDGFEPSGNIHIAQGILRAINVNKMIDAGCRFKILIADWHVWANNKLGGNLDNIKIAGKYFMEVWKAADVDMSKVEILWASDLVKDDEYWKKVMQVARNNTVNRIVRCSQIMGRSEKDALHASQILYPCMQAADIFHLDIDIAQLGMDQRKVNVLAREIAPKLGYNKPIAVHHHMLMGLDQPPKAELSGAERGIELKMSKSKPDTAIFMTDSEEDIKRKMNKAYCPEGIVEENPIMEYCKYILFEKIKSLKIERPAKWGGNLEFSSYAELEAAFSKKELHPMDLKQAVSSEISKLIEPVRKHFEKGKAKELLEQVKSFEITR
ncbi:MAG: tyrosine--tRNA ligase [Nanoarchaeota archaeon]